MSIQLPDHIRDAFQVGMSMPRASVGNGIMVSAWVTPCSPG